MCTNWLNESVPLVVLSGTQRRLEISDSKPGVPLPVGGTGEDVLKSEKISERCTWTRKIWKALMKIIGKFSD